MPTGRFGAEDPIKDQLNWYGYCANNPIALVDPTGLVGLRTNFMMAGFDQQTSESVDGGNNAPDDPRRPNDIMHPNRRADEAHLERTQKAIEEMNAVHSNTSPPPNGAAILLTDTGSFFGGDYNLANPFGHSALAIQDNYGQWWIMDVRAVGYASTKSTVVFSPLEDIVFGANWQSIISAYFDHPERSASDVGFNVNRYNNQLFIQGDFTASLIRADELSRDGVNFNLLGQNCIWVALYVLKQSTYGTDAYSELDDMLWLRRLLFSEGIGEFMEIQNRKTIIPNNVPERLYRIMRDAGFDLAWANNVHLPINSLRECAE